jgi:DNA-directed RNA polymerase specialized sigma24 family protein
MEDSDIILEARTGNKGAYREMLRKYADLALAVAFARSGNKATTRAAASDAFVEASRELVGLPDAAPIAPWLAGVTRLVTARNMGTARQIPLTLDAAKERIRKAVEEAGGPGDLTPERRSELALEALATLPEEVREALCLRHLYSMDYSDIASAKASDVNEIDSQLAKAREHLTEILEPLF